ncbi:hypothetical protein CMZ82_09160 [Lysobacteraceae bacterium NML93-0792]|nr:hypothetical protein CMZ82_09160 [Xanthomonadaceae bacterium NML93-0792]PBS15486.1 hypothetical protein CMZ81_10510 [Xanthomonadaceae bacterium NML93-0793]PBS20370.1 hypothetical protein CMZ80_00485 [Xanthomonadaceae bacterium NML93-0831]
MTPSPAQRHSGSRAFDDADPAPYGGLEAFVQGFVDQCVVDGYLVHPAERVEKRPQTGLAQVVTGVEAKSGTAP